MIRKTFLNSQISTKSTTNDRPLGHLLCFVIYPTFNDTARNNPVQGEPAQRRVSCTSPHQPSLPSQGWAQHSATEKGVGQKYSHRKAMRFCLDQWNRGGYRRWAVRKQEQGTGLCLPGVASGWIRLKCIVKLFHKGNVHTQEHLRAATQT